MSTTRLDRQRALSDRLRGAWEAHRDGRDWEAVYSDAREAVASGMERDAALVRAMSWGNFKRLQGIGMHAAFSAVSNVADSTKRFARTSQAEPWRGVLTHHKRPLAERVSDVLLATVLGICGAALLVHCLSG